MKPGNLNFLEPSGPLQACKGTALPYAIRYKHQVGLLWTSDRLVSEAATYTAQQTQETNIHALSGIRKRSPSNQEGSDRTAAGFAAVQNKNRQENRALQGHYAASNGNFLPTFRDNLSVPKSAVPIYFVTEACNHAKTGKIGHRGKDIQCLRNSSLPWSSSMNFKLVSPN